MIGRKTGPLASPPVFIAWTKYSNPLSDFKPIISDSTGRISNLAVTGNCCILIAKISNRIGKKNAGLFSSDRCSTEKVSAHDGQSPIVCAF